MSATTLKHVKDLAMQLNDRERRQLVAELTRSLQAHEVTENEDDILLSGSVAGILKTLPPEDFSDWEK